MASTNSGRLVSRLMTQNGKPDLPPGSAAGSHEVKAPISVAQADGDLFGIADEPFFNRMLSLERRRTERTGDPFVLMLVDLRQLVRASGLERVEQVCASIRSQTRETDLPGWYKHPSTVGVVYTALCSAERDVIRQALAEKADQALQAALDAAEREMVQVTFHFFPEDVDRGKPAIKSDETLYPDLTRKNGSGRIYNAMKRALDLAGSLGGLILFAPVFALISILIKISSKGPVFYKQRRIGKFGHEFWFLKFRSMYVNNNHEIHEQYVRKLILQGEKKAGVEQAPQRVYKIVEDPRVTLVGRFLRQSSLDELPQLINVLKGEMSLVGPRPPIPYEVSCYRFWHRRRVIEVKPGITGLWQVAGRSRTTFDDMVRLDLRYIRDQSLLLDLKILLKTPWAVLSGAGAY